MMMMMMIIIMMIMIIIILNNNIITIIIVIILSFKQHLKDVSGPHVTSQRDNFQIKAFQHIFQLSPFLSTYLPI